MSRATNVQYGDTFEFYRRVIRSIMALASDSHHLSPREVDVLAVMCIVEHRGMDLEDYEMMSNELVLRGLPYLQATTIKNYKVKLKRKHWLVLDSERRLLPNAHLRKAIQNGGLAIGVFLNEAKTDG